MTEIVSSLSKPVPRPLQDGQMVGRAGEQAGRKKQVGKVTEIISDQFFPLVSILPPPAGVQATAQNSELGDLGQVNY